MLLDYHGKNQLSGCCCRVGMCEHVGMVSRRYLLSVGTLILQTIGDGSRVCNSKASSFSCQPTRVYHTGELCQNGGGDCKRALCLWANMGRSFADVDAIRTPGAGAWLRGEFGTPRSYKIIHSKKERRPKNVDYLSTEKVYCGS